MPEYSIKVDHPDFPKGTEFQVAQLYAELKNGSTTHVDNDTAEIFKAFHGRTVLQGLADTHGFEVSSAGSSKKEGDS